MPLDDLELKRLLLEYKDLVDRQLEIGSAITALEKESFNNTIRLNSLKSDISVELRKYNFEEMVRSEED